MNQAAKFQAKWRTLWNFLWLWVDRVGLDSYLNKQINTFDGHFDIEKKSIHFDIDSIDWSNNYRAIL